MTTAQIVMAVIAGVVGLAGLTWSIIQFRRSGHKVTAELGFGKIDDDGVLKVEFASGRSLITKVKPKESQAKRVKRARVKRDKQRTLDDVDVKEFRPAQAIFIHNVGRAAVTITRCQYSGLMTNDVAFDFEPQGGTVLWGDELPKRLESGEDAILVHDSGTMQAFLALVLQDQGAESGRFNAFLTLGNGEEVLVKTAMGARADLPEEEMARAGVGRLHVREDIPSHQFHLPRQRLWRRLVGR